MKIMKDSNMPSTLLIDIEGTTTSISFVKDVLFPYARSEMEPFLRENWTNSDVQELIGLVRDQSHYDAKKGLLPEPLPDPESEPDQEKLIRGVLDNLIWQMDNDRKTTGLKTIQGKIWWQGYVDGILKSQVYPDVPKAFERWSKSGRKLFIYSSGSVEAQILLFQHTENGDLSNLLSGYFDTTSGSKVESKSYINIASKIGVKPQDILFFTDITKEAYAAKEAGLEVAVLVRPGNAALTFDGSDELPTLQSFDECISE
ncbi:enolase-phosphatase E1 [Folsomia candida]|uniref:enolase-phosphatase E1 n=1 Tax=Folsomia candida TaxID=158441 RepID=UPI000B8FC908|nr:enolase-phosphatase E1 [Folsomia candida]